MENCTSGWGLGGPGVKVAELWRRILCCPVCGVCHVGMVSRVGYTDTLPKAIFDLPGMDV